MKPFLVTVCLVVGGAFLGYFAGREYCFHLLNIGAIYDESFYIPPDIADGSAYGRAWAFWGALASLVFGVGVHSWRYRNGAVAFSSRK